MKTLIALVLSYIAAAPLTTLVSFNLAQTEWTNILTYVWIAFGWLVWVVLIGVAATVIGAVAK